MLFFLVRYRSPASLKAERKTGVPGRSSNLATSHVLLDLFSFLYHKTPQTIKSPVKAFLPFFGVKLF
jgi:hypothetical protein